MRTTLDIDEDILLVAKELASRRGASMGKVLSDLARQTLTQAPETMRRNGLPLFPRQPGAGVITLELVNQLRDETS